MSGPCSASGLAPERRDLFLQRCAAMLKVRGLFGDRDVEQIAQRALVGLMHQPAMALPVWRG